MVTHKRAAWLSIAAAPSSGAITPSIGSPCGSMHKHPHGHPLSTSTAGTPAAAATTLVNRVNKRGCRRTLRNPQARPTEPHPPTQRPAARVSSMGNGRGNDKPCWTVYTLKAVEQG